SRVEKTLISGEHGASKGCMPRSEEGGWKRLYEENVLAAYPTSTVRKAPGGPYPELLRRYLPDNKKGDLIMDRLYKKNIPSEYVEKKIKDTKYEPAKERLKRWQELFNEYDGKESNFQERVKSIKFRDDKK